MRSLLLVNDLPDVKAKVRLERGSPNSSQLFRKQALVARAPAMSHHKTASRYTRVSPSIPYRTDKLPPRLKNTLDSAKYRDVPRC